MNVPGEPGAGGLAARLGIFARTFRRETPEEVAAAVAQAGYALGHWNFAAIGRATLACDVDAALVATVRRAFDSAGLGIPSVSATYNVIHPDTERRAAQTDLRRTLDDLLQAADSAGVRLGIEPEPGNVVRDARRAARLLAELGPGAPVGIILDPANLLSPGTVSRQPGILAEAVDLLGPRVLGVQAKDVVAGAGLIDWPQALGHLARLPPVPLTVQDVAEDDAARVRDDLLRWHRQAGQVTAG